MFKTLFPLPVKGLLPLRCVDAGQPELVLRVRRIQHGHSVTSNTDYAAREGEGTGKLLCRQKSDQTVRDAF